MARNRNDPDPFEDRRRKLAEQERLLTEQRRKLHSELTQSGDAAAKPKSAEHPVWRMEDEPAPTRGADPTPARKRNLARQRQHDMIKLVAFIIVLLVVVVIALLVLHFHGLAPSNGA